MDNESQERLDKALAELTYEVAAKKLYSVAELLNQRGFFIDEIEVLFIAEWLERKSAKEPQTEDL